MEPRMDLVAAADFDRVESLQPQGEARPAKNEQPRIIKITRWLSNLWPQSEIPWFAIPGRFGPP
jgi:hypothetical protein